jgi:aspartate beta-hydroxylase
MMSKREQALREAQVASEAGDDASAAAKLTQLLAQFPDEARAHNMLGMIALRRQEGTAAAVHFRAAIVQDPAEGALYLNLATALRLTNDDAGELAALQGALNADQRDFMAWRRKAELHERRGENALTLQAWTNALRLSAHIDPMPDVLAQVLARAGQWVALHNARYGDGVDAALDAARAAVPTAERRRFDACANATLGRRQIYANQCEGLHFPFLPADEFFEDHHFPWMDEIEARTDAIRAELLALLASGAAGLQPYVQQQPGLPQNIWTELNGSLDWSAYFLWNYGARIDDACARCPETAAALDLIPRVNLSGRAPTAFFSILKPGKHIPAHSGVTNTRAIVHLPLIVPSGCRFRVGGETRSWVEGKAFAFDDTIEHEAWNDSDELRAVLIFDVWNPHITLPEQRLLQQLCKAIDGSGYSPGMSDAR